MPSSKKVDKSASKPSSKIADQSTIKTTASQKAQDQQINLVVSIMTFSLGVMCTVYVNIYNEAAPKVLSLAFNPENYPSHLTAEGESRNYLAFDNYLLLSGLLLFGLSTATMVLRVSTGKGLPAEMSDGFTIQSINEQIKNFIVYNAIFLGMMFYVKTLWEEQGEKQPFYIKIMPFLLWAILVLETFCRAGQIIIKVKGIRYLAHGVMTIFLGIVLIEIVGFQH